MGLPGRELTDFEHFRAYAEESTYASEGEAGPDDGCVIAG